MNGLLCADVSMGSPPTLKLDRQTPLFIIDNLIQPAYMEVKSEKIHIQIQTDSLPTMYKK